MPSDSLLDALGGRDFCATCGGHVLAIAETSRRLRVVAYQASSRFEGTAIRAKLEIPDAKAARAKAREQAQLHLDTEHAKETTQ